MYNLFKKILPALKQIFVAPFVSSVPATEIFKTYIKFDISHPNIGTINDAELHLVVAYNTGGTHTVEVYGLDDLHAGENWGESTITWNNAPANDANNDLIAGDVTLLGSFTVSPSDVVGTKKIFTSSGLVTWLNLDTDRLVTIILRRTDVNYSQELYFASKEHTTYDGPKLIINQPKLNMYTVGKEAPTVGYQNLYTNGY